MHVTKQEVATCKRAVVVLSELARVGLEAGGQDEPIKVKQDRLTLIKVIRRLEAIAK